MKVFSSVLFFFFTMFLGASADAALRGNDAATTVAVDARVLKGHKSVPVCKPHGPVDEDTGLNRNYTLKYVGKWVSFYLIHVLSIRGPGKKIHGAPGYKFDDDCTPVLIEE
mmetsp:Transcript_7965/g.22157  ORF Transcript_7965/g.22157 Transcript_7965/m.22157 type:complete len:111 (+) Transcript_7965:364-696(+)